MMERERKKLEGRHGGRESAQVCVMEWIIAKTPLSTHHCNTHTRPYTRGVQTLCILMALSPPAIIPDNGSLSRHSSSEVSFVLSDRLMRELTG